MVRTYTGIFTLIALAGGILLAEATRLPALLFIGAATLMLLTTAILLAIRAPSLATATIALTLLAVSSSNFARQTYDLGARHISRFTDADTRWRIFATVDDWPDIRSDRIDLTLALDSIGVDFFTPADGRLLLKVADTTPFVQYGDHVELFARLFPIGGGAGAFDYGRYLRLKGIHALAFTPAHDDLRRAPRSPVGLLPLIDSLRANITASLTRTLDSTAAPLAAGFLIGETRNIPRAVYRSFRDSGTLHLLAVSGSNVALVIGFVLVLLRPFRIGRTPRTLILMAALLLFALLCKGEPSVVRASVMAGTVLLAMLLGRPVNLNNVVALAAAAILLVNPAQLFNVGFQLSFVTAWGLVFITPKAYRFLDRKSFGPIHRYLLLALIVSLTAQLFSSPLVAYHFHRLPLLTTPANLVIVPLVSVAVIGILLLLVLDFLFPPLALLTGGLLNLLSDLILTALDLFSGPSAPMIDTNLTLLDLVAAYAVLIALGFALTSIRARRFALVAALILLNVTLVRAAVPARTDSYALHLSNVPGGLAAALVPDGRNRADLLITCLTVRPYPLDERVLAPWLERLNIKRLGRVILLAADFDAAAQLVRLTDSLGVDSILVHQRLAATFSDLAAARSRPLPWAAFGDNPPTPAGGWLLTGPEVTLTVGPHACCFFRHADQLAARLAELDTTRPPAWLICGDRIGGDLPPAPPDAVAGLVCAGVEQTPPSSLDNCIDLHRSGPLTLRLSPRRPPELAAP